MRIINIGMIESFRYTGINLGGWIQGVGMNKKSFCVSSNSFFFKDNVETAHCVGHSQLRSLDTDDFFKRTPVVDEK